MYEEQSRIDLSVAHGDGNEQEKNVIALYFMLLLGTALQIQSSREILSAFGVIGRHV